MATHVQRLRAKAGGSFHEADFQGLKALIAALRRGELVGVMGDRDIQGTGVRVEMAGRHVKLPRGPWELARRTGLHTYQRVEAGNHVDGLVDAHPDRLVPLVPLLQQAIRTPS